MEIVIQVLFKLFILCLMQVQDHQLTGNWSHNLSDGTTPHERRVDVNLNGYMGEILYKGDCSWSNAINKWGESEIHNEVLSSPENNISVGIMIPDSDGKCYGIMIFSRIDMTENSEYNKEE